MFNYQFRKAFNRTASIKCFHMLLWTFTACSWKFVNCQLIHHHNIPITCIGLGIIKAGKVKKKGRADNNVKVGKIIFCCSLRSRYFHLAEKYQAFSLNSQQQKVQRFYLLTGTIHHVIVIGDFLVLYLPIWSWYSTYRETKWLISTSRNWKPKLKSEILSKDAGRFTHFFSFSAVFWTFLLQQISYLIST